MSSIKMKRYQCAVFYIFGCWKWNDVQKAVFVNFKVAYVNLIVFGSFLEQSICSSLQHFDQSVFCRHFLTREFTFNWRKKFSHNFLSNILIGWWQDDDVYSKKKCQKTIFERISRWWMERVMNICMHKIKLAYRIAKNALLKEYCRWHCVLQ